MGTEPIAGSLVFLSPLGGLTALALVLPIAALAVGAGLERRAREILRLPPPAPVARLPLALALAAIPALLGLAAAQPAWRSTTEEHVRTDAQALFVVDVSRSMLAAGAAGGQTRIERARSGARTLRAALPEVPSGIATMTDRVLPNLLPIAGRSAFDHTLEEAVAVNQPPPASSGAQATTLAALGAVGSENFFPALVRRRLLVVLTDGESRAFDASAVARALGQGPGVRTILVHVWAPDEQIFGVGEAPEPGYHPDPASREVLTSLASATGGSVFGENSLGAASRALRAAAGSGPELRRGTIGQTRTLAPYAALAALGPLGFLLLGRRTRRARRLPAATPAA